MEKKLAAEITCELCHRAVNFITRHHLIPKEEGGKYSDTVNLCQPCHSTIHLNFTNQELARDFQSITALQQAQSLQKYLRWIRNKKIDVLKNRRGKK